MLDDAFKQAIDINRESSFVEAATGRPNDQANTRIDTQINELEDSFQDYDINAMSARWFIRLVACVGSGDPVRVLRLYTTITLDEVCSIYC